MAEFERAILFLRLFWNKEVVRKDIRFHIDNLL
jgi:hypothetical protein